MPIKPLDRRAFLRGTGAAICLPFLEAMLPINRSWAAPPSRFGALYIGNGMLTGRGANSSINDYWSCQGNANGITTMSAPVQRLAAHKNYLTIVQNCSFDFLTQTAGASAHEVANTGFLAGQSGMHSSGLKPPTARPVQIERLQQPGMSLDRMIASTRNTRIKSLMMGVGPMNTRFTIYDVPKHIMGNLSWDSQTGHLQTEMLYTAYETFRKLTSAGISGSSTNTGGNAAAQAFAQKKSILDGAVADVNALMSRLGTADKQVLNEYLTSLRKIESELQQVPTTPTMSCAAPSAAKQAAYNADSFLNFNQITQTANYMIELTALAYQCGITDVATIMLSYDNSLVPGGQIMAGYGVQNTTSGSVHGASHYVVNSDPNALNITKGMNLWHVDRAAYMASLLKAIPDSDGRSILDNSLIMLGAGMGDPDNHNFTNMLRVLIGKGAGLNPGANGRLINAGGGQFAHPKLLQTIAGGFGIRTTVGLSSGQTIAGVLG